jgi:hypothetical protein
MLVVILFLTNLLTAKQDKTMKNEHAVALGSLGGKARSRSTTPEQRRRWARIGGLARARKYPKALLSRWASLGGPRKQSKR